MAAARVKRAKLAQEAKQRKAEARAQRLAEKQAEEEQERQNMWYCCLLSHLVSIHRLESSLGIRRDQNGYVSVNLSLEDAGNHKEELSTMHIVC